MPTAHCLNVDISIMMPDSARQWRTVRRQTFWIHNDLMVHPIWATFEVQKASLTKRFFRHPFWSFRVGPAEMQQSKCEVMTRSNTTPKVWTLIRKFDLDWFRLPWSIFSSEDHLSQTFESEEREKHDWDYDKLHAISKMVAVQTGMRMKPDERLRFQTEKSHFCGRFLVW